MKATSLQFDPATIEVRSFREEDASAVQNLYEHGLLAGQQASNDTGADIDNIIHAYLDSPKHHFWVATLPALACGGREGDRAFDNSDDHPATSRPLDSDGRCVVGMIGVASDDEHTAEIRRLRVDRGFQGSGIGQILLETAVNHCRHHGFLKVRLDTRFERDAAVDLFDRIGFQHTRTRERDAKELLEFYLDIYRVVDDKNQEQ